MAGPSPQTDRAPDCVTVLGARNRGRNEDSVLPQPPGARLKQSAAQYVNTCKNMNWRPENFWRHFPPLQGYLHPFRQGFAGKQRVKTRAHPPVRARDKTSRRKKSYFKLKRGTGNNFEGGRVKGRGVENIGCILSFFQFVKLTSGLIMTVLPPPEYDSPREIKPRRNRRQRPPPE